MPVARRDGMAARMAAGVGVSTGSAATGSGSGGSVDTRLVCMAVHALASLQYCCAPEVLNACVRHVATAGADRLVKVWDLQGGFCTHSFTGHRYHSCWQSRVCSAAVCNTALWSP